TIGHKIPIITGLGCTESGPSALFANRVDSFSGLLGIPVAGLHIKLSPVGAKKEIRYKGPNITPGYWRNEAATQNSLDEEGYYKTGDAVQFLNEDDPDQGLVFDGRIAEDFKLNTGTWVNVGILRSKLVVSCAPVIQDVVLAGLNKAYIGAILFLNTKACKGLIPEDVHTTDSLHIHNHPVITDYLERVLIEFNKNGKGSSTIIQYAVIALDPPSIESGEITDKGSLNQQAIIQQRAHLIDKLFDQTNNPSRIII
ncbi:MAG: feruloyl-CoA synthase, partial [Saprospiraceae bacterium]